MTSAHVLQDRNCGVEPYYSLEEAARKFFPGGKISARSLRTEIGHGNLPRIKIAEMAEATSNKGETP